MAKKKEENEERKDNLLQPLCNFSEEFSYRDINQKLNIMAEKRLVTMLISVEIVTDKPIEKIVSALKKGIYRGLDTEPNYIAQPKDVTINSIKENIPFPREVVECIVSGIHLKDCDSDGYCNNCRHQEGGEY